MTRLLCRLTGHRLVIKAHRCNTPNTPCRLYSHAAACWCGAHTVIWPVR